VENTIYFNIFYHEALEEYEGDFRWKKGKNA
jgi:hypothetical protein